MRFTRAFPFFVRGFFELIFYLTRHPPLPVSKYEPFVVRNDKIDISNTAILNIEKEAPLSDR